MKQIGHVLKIGMLIVVLTISVVLQLNAQQQAGIGVFDSGTGGLTVLEAILKLDAYNNVTGATGADGKPDFEKEYFTYLADQANMPYGNYAAEGKTTFLQAQILKNMGYLLGKDSLSTTKPVKAIVVACNTATAYALSEIQQFVRDQRLSVPVVGVIDAGARAALAIQKKNQGTIAVFATAGTVASNGYPRTILQLANQAGVQVPEVISQGGVGLAESIDRDWSYFVDSATAPRVGYKGPSLQSSALQIQKELLPIYNFDQSTNKLLCESDGKGGCLEMQLNDPSNYVRYHLVSLLEKALAEGLSKPINTLILGCTHYPYVKDTINAVLQELYQVRKGSEYRYRKVLANHVFLVDPAIETAKECWQILFKQQLLAREKKGESNFIITVPNKDLVGVQLQDDGWFTYAYKYGRNLGTTERFVTMIPFDDKVISAATYKRFKDLLPAVYKSLQLCVPGL